MRLLGDTWSVIKRLALLDQSMKQTEIKLEAAVGELKVLGEHIHQLDIRLARLEETRDLEKQRVETELERFKLQVERFELRVKQLPALRQSDTSE